MSTVYYVEPKKAKPLKITLLNLISGNIPRSRETKNNTVTYRRDEWFALKNEMGFDTGRFIELLKNFNETYDRLRDVPRASLYNHFKIPKKSGGLRPIDAPNEELTAALRSLIGIFESEIGAYYHHPCAFAYVRERCTVDVAKVHQQAGSKWFAKFDFSNFFGSTTLDFILRMCAIIHPLNLVMKEDAGRTELTKALELCFLNGGLPQGTPASPFLTNLMMIPIDHELLDYAANNTPHLIYTRYADDIQISCKYDFDYKEVEKEINTILQRFDAPFKIKPEKTHYNSLEGSNWILGVMLNKDNCITIGHEKKKIFKAMLCSFSNDWKNGRRWSYDDLHHLYGLISYYRMVEKEYINYIIETYGKKFGLDIEQSIKKALKGETA